MRFGKDAFVQELGKMSSYCRLDIDWIIIARERSGLAAITHKIEAQDKVGVTHIE